jgi:uncharacterized protein YjbI with pentapeptide repeats
MDFTSPWTIAAVGGALLALTVIPGVYLWWPSRSKELAKSDLGLALMTGALIAFSVLVLEFLLTQRARKLESVRQDEAEKQALQLLVGRQRNLAGIDLGCSAAEKDADCGEVLDGFYLSGKILTDANLRGSSLQQVRLENARLQQAILAGADMEGANLEGAHLERAILDRARLHGAVLRFANLEGARLRGAQLPRANLDFALLRADLAGAQLVGASLFGADLANANLRGAKLQRADLRSASLAGANLAGADLRNAMAGGADFTNARFDDATDWPSMDEKWPRSCDGEPPCVFHGEAPPEAKRELAALRHEFGRCLPAGWVAAPRDPGGFLFTAPIHGAIFFGERHGVRPGSPLVEFAREWRESARLDDPKLREKIFAPARRSGPHRLREITGARLWIARFEFRPRDPARRGQAWEQVEVYGVGEDAGYRFVGAAPADVFMLFDRDFAEFFSTLGLDPRSAFPAFDRDLRRCDGSATVRPANGREDR